MKEDRVDADGKMRDCTSDNFFFYKVRGNKNERGEIKVGGLGRLGKI